MSEKITRFEDIIAWQKAKHLCLEVYHEFKNCSDFSFRDQIRRAAISVMNNIAEGYERKGDKQLKHFLFMAKGSSGEVRSMLLVARELGYMEENKHAELASLAEEVSKILSGFISKLK